MMKDTDFRAEAAKLDLDLDPIDGDDLGQLVRAAMDISQADADDMKRFYDDLFGSMK
jgi:hypothetical protein